MGANTKIEWADHTWNPWWGCTKVSVGDKGACEFCYAEPLAHRFGVGWGPHAPRRLAGEAHWRLPERWNRAACRDQTRPFVFTASMADIFDNQVPTEWRRRAFNTMRNADRCVWLLLTKRPSMIERLCESAGGLPPNAALGCSIVTQEEAARDVPWLISAASRLRPLFTFLSCEPLMEAIDLRRMRPPGDPINFDGLRRNAIAASVDWVIAGGESGPKARPSHPDWFRGLRDQCASAGVPFLFKQHGEWAPYSGAMQYAPPHRAAHVWPRPEPEKLPAPLFDPTSILVGKKAAGRLLDGVEHNGFPAGFGKDERAAA